MRCSDHRHITSSVPMGDMYRDSWPGLHLHGTQGNDRVDDPMSPSTESETSSTTVVVVVRIICLEQASSQAGLKIKPSGMGPWAVLEWPSNPEVK